MPAIAPSEFVAKAEGKGFLFSLKPDGSLGVKAPAPDAMTDRVRQYVREQKADLVALIASRTPVVGREVSPSEVPKSLPRSAVAPPTRTFQPPERTQGRIAQERVFALVATGRLSVWWPTHAPTGEVYGLVSVSQGITTANPRAWFKSAWERYCHLWHKVHGESGQALWQENPSRWHRALESLEILYTDLLNVLDQSEPLPNEADEPCPPVEAGRVVYGAWVERSRERYRICPELLPPLPPSLVAELRGIIGESETKKV